MRPHEGRRMRPRTTLIPALCSLLVLLTPLTNVSAASTAESHVPVHRLVRLTLRDGSFRIARLDGVGCNESLCSRIAMNTQTIGSAVVNHTRLADVAALRSIDGAGALFVFRDGSTHWLSVVPDNRVLYVIGADGRIQKVGLSRLTSIDFDITR